MCSLCHVSLYPINPKYEDLKYTFLNKRLLVWFAHNHFLILKQIPNVT